MKQAEKTKAILKHAEKTRLSKEKSGRLKEEKERKDTFEKVKKGIRATFKKEWLPKINEAASKEEDKCYITVSDRYDSDYGAAIVSCGLELLEKEGYTAFYDHSHYHDPDYGAVDNYYLVVKLK